MHIILGGEERFFSEEYIINQFLAKEICSCAEKLVFLYQLRISHTWDSSHKNSYPREKTYNSFLK